MQKRELERQTLLKQAKLVFVDSDNYSDEQLISYCRLLNKIMSEEELTENFASIAGLNEDLKSLDERSHQVIQLHLLENYTLRKIGELFGVTLEIIRRIEANALRLLRKSAYHFSSTKNKDKNKFRLDFISEINEKIDSKTDFKISELKFISRDTLRLLTRLNIHYVSELLKFKEEDLKYYYGYKLECKYEIRKIQELFLKEPELIYKKLHLAKAIRDGVKFEYDFKIIRLNISNRTCNALNRRGIFLASQFLAITLNDLKNFRNIGPVSIEEIITTQNMLWYGEI